MQHNDMPVKQTTPLGFQVADFRGRYVDVMANSAEAAVQKFVDGKTCNYDTPWHLSQQWRAAGCPDRAAWLELQALSA